jgi:phosphoribosylformimino-5-aminoimidazole carboxamide ribotide isomerase
MKIIPKIILRRNQLLQKEEYKYKFEDILDLGKFLQDKGITCVHIIDLDGKLSKKPINIKEAAKLKKLNLTLQFEGGINNKQLVKTALEEGVDKVVLSVQVAMAPYFIQELTKNYKDKIICYIEAYNNIVMMQGWYTTTEYTASDLALQLKRGGLEEIIFKELKRRDLFGGLNLEAIKKFVDTTDVNIQIADITKEEEVEELLKRIKTRLTGFLINEDVFFTQKIDLDKVISQVKAQLLIKEEEKEERLKEEKVIIVEEPESIFSFIQPIVPIQSEEFHLHKEAIKELQAEIEANKKVLVEGEYGLGKTTLLVNTMVFIKPKYKILWYSFKQDSLPEVFLTYLALEASLVNSIKEYKDLNKKLNLLIKKLPKDLVLFLDDLHLIKDYNLKKIITTLTNDLDLPMVMTTSQALDYSLSINKKIVLDRLSKEETIEFLRQLRVDEKDEVLEEIYRKIGGEPLLLFYFAGLVNRFWHEPLGLLRKLPSLKDEMQTFLLERIFNDISDDIKGFLGMMSLLRKPVDIFILKPLYEGIGFDDMFESLKQTVGLVRTTDEKYALPIHLSKFILMKLGAKRYLHRRIANIYTNVIKDTDSKNIEDYLELYYHHFNSGDFKSAVSLLIDKSEDLMRLGWYDTLLRELSKPWKYTIKA